jgi:large subunit ribosomal protein L35
MPKQKTNRGAVKRFKVTGTGAVRRAHAMKSHILTKKPNKRKRRLRKGVGVDKADVGAVRKMLNI